METLGLSPRTGWPCQYTSPALEGESPVSMRRRVDFPQPEGPSRAMIFPGYTARSVAEMTWMRVPSGLRVKFFKFARFDDRLWGRCWRERRRFADWRECS